MEEGYRPGPSRVIAEQRKTIAELESLVDILKGALAASGQDEALDYKPWMAGLTPQERALVGALYKSYPRPLDKYVLLDLLPGHDHVEERRVQLVAIKVHHVRKKLGPGAIEHLSGVGYRLGVRQYQAMRTPGGPEIVEQRLAA